MKMPRKRREAATPKPAALASSAEVEEATREMIARLGDDETRTPERIKKDERKEAKLVAQILETGVVPEFKAKPFTPPTWQDRQADIAAKRAADDARIALTATEAEPATTDAAEPQAPSRPLKRFVAGHAGYLDPRLIDDDDDEAWS